MSKREVGTSASLGRRIADLKARMRNADVTQHEMQIFQKVAAIMGSTEGALRLDTDDMIAASFVAEAPSDPTLN